MDKVWMFLVLSFTGLLGYFLLLAIIFPYNWLLKQNKVAAVINILFAAYYLIYAVTIYPWIEWELEGAWDYIVLLSSNSIAIGLFIGFISFAIECIGKNLTEKYVEVNPNKKEVLEDNYETYDELDENHEELDNEVEIKEIIAETNSTIVLESNGTSMNETKKGIIDILDNKGNITDFGKEIGVVDYEDGKFYIRNPINNMEFAVGKEGLKGAINAYYKNKARAEKEARAEAEAKLVEQLPEEPTEKVVEEVEDKEQIPTENPIFQTIRESEELEVPFTEIIEEQEKELTKLRNAYKKNPTQENAIKLKEQTNRVKEYKSAFDEYQSINQITPEFYKKMEKQMTPEEYKMAKYERVKKIMDSWKERPISLEEMIAQSRACRKMNEMKNKND